MTCTNPLTSNPTWGWEGECAASKQGYTLKKSCSWHSLVMFCGCFLAQGCSGTSHLISLKKFIIFMRDIQKKQEYTGIMFVFECFWNPARSIVNLRRVMTRENRLMVTERFQERQKSRINKKACRGTTIMVNENTLTCTGNLFDYIDNLQIRYYIVNICEY